MSDLAFSELEEAFFRAGEQLPELSFDSAPWWHRVLRLQPWPALFVPEPADDYVSYELVVADDSYELAA
jgi:hypothetical protein